MHRLLWPITFLLSFTGVAAAADAIDPNSGSFDLAKAAYDAFSGGHYAYAAAIGVILALALIKRWLGGKIAWLHSDVGGAVMVLAMSAAGAMASGLASGGPITWALAKSALLVGVGAAGGFSILKKLVIVPLLMPLRAKLPTWADPIFDLVMWAFDKPDAQADATAAAAKAGQDAVTANPSQGVAGVLGQPTEVK